MNPFPPIIRGCWQLAGGHGAVDEQAAIADMAAFVRAGVGTFDCADIYTGVEALIGRFRAAHPDLAAGLRVHTKYVPDLDTLATVSAADVDRTVERSRRRLGVEALDLVQFHWWDCVVPRYVETARALEAVARRGLVQAVGGTNFDTARLAEICDAGVPIVSHQVQYSLLDRRPAGSMAAFCLARGISLLCYGSLAGGFLSERWLGANEPAAPLENRSLVKYKLIIDECGGWDPFQALLERLRQVADRHGVGIGTVAIRWVLDQPAVASVIVGARSTAHLHAVTKALSISLTDAERHGLEEALPRSVPGEVYELERDREGPHGRIMRYNLGA